MIQSERKHNDENNKLFDSVKWIYFILFFFNNNKDWNDRAGKNENKKLWKEEIKV